MILVDTSVWVDFFSRSPSRAGTELCRMIADAEPFALSGVIVSEILQGLRRDVDQIELLSHGRGSYALESTPGA